MVDSKIQQLFTFIEKYANKLDSSEQVGNNKFDTDMAKSLFAEDIRDEVKRQNMSQQDADSIAAQFGIELSLVQAEQPVGSTSKSGVAHAPRKAAEGGNGDGGDDGNTTTINDGGGSYTINVTGDGKATVVINNYINVIVSLTVNADIQETVETLIQAIIDGNKETLDSLKEWVENNILTVIKAMFLEFRSDNDLNFSNLTKVLKDLFAQLGLDVKNTGDMIAALLERSFQKIYMQFGENMEKLFEMLKDMPNPSNPDSGDNNALLIALYDAIQNLTENFKNYNNDQSNLLKQVIALLTQGNTLNEMGYEKILAILEAIKNDTSENNSISKELLQAIKDGNQEVINAITQVYEAINQLDEDIKNKFNVLVEAVIANGGKIEDLKEILEVIRQENKENAQAIIDKLTEGNNISKEIYEAIKNLKIDVDVDLGDEIKNLLTQILNKIGIGGGGGGTVQVDLSEITNLLKDMKALLALIKGDTGATAETTKEVLEFLKTMSQQLESFSADVKAGFLSLANNIVANGGKLDDLKQLMQAIIQRQDLGNDKLQQILDAIKELDTNMQASATAIATEMINNGKTFEEILEALGRIENQNEQILAAIKEGNQIAQNIYDAIQNLDLSPEVKVELGDEIKSLLTQILNKIGIGGGSGDVTVQVDLSTIEQILQSMKNLLSDIKDGQSETQETLQLILAAIKDMDANQQAGFEAVIAAIMANGGKIEELKPLLEAIKNSQDENNATAKEILAAIGTMDANMQAFASDIVASMVANGAKLDDVKALLQENNQKLQAIYDAIKELDADMQAIAGDLVATMVANGAKMDDVKALLVQIKQENKENAQAIIKAIKDGYAEINAAFNELSAQLQEDFGGLKDWLMNIYNKIGLGGGGGTGGDVNVTVDLSEITSLLRSMKILLEGIKDGQKETQGIAKDILAAIKDMDANQQAGFEAVIAAIMANGGKIEELKPLLEAIKNSQDENNATAKEILAAIGTMDANMQAFASDIVASMVANGAKLDDVKALLQENNQKLQAIYDAIKELDADMQAIAGDLVATMVANGAKMDDVKALLEQIKQENKENAEAIINAIKDGYAELTAAFNDLSDDMKAEFGGIKDLLVNIYNKIGLGGGGGTVQVDLSKIENLLQSMKELLQGIKDGQEETQGIARDILAAIKDLDANQQAGFESVIAAIMANGGKIDDLKPLLEAIKNSQDENNATAKEILAAIGTMDANMQALAGDLVSAIVANGGKLDDIKVLIQEGNETAKDILQAIKDFRTEFGAGVEQIVAAIVANTESLEDVKTLIETNTAVLREILAEVKDLNAEVKKGFLSVAGAVVANGGKLDDLKTLLEQIKADTTEGNRLSQAILDAINDLGLELKPQFEALLTAINNGTGAIEELKQLLEDIKELTAGNGEKLDSIITNQGTIISILEGLKAEVASWDPNGGDNYAKFIADLDELIGDVQTGECNCDVDAEALMAMLQQILEAIQNHECHCNCGGDDGDTNEGILSRMARVMRGGNFEDEETGISALTQSEQNEKVEITYQGRTLNMVPYRKYAPNALANMGISSKVPLMCDKFGNLFDTLGRKVN